MLPKPHRLTFKSSFENVRQNGRHVNGKLMSVSYVKRPASVDTTARQARFGFIVSKKISMKSHERNRVKRILREIIHANITEIKPGIDFVIVAKPGIMHADHATIETELKNVVKNI